MKNIVKKVSWQHDSYSFFSNRPSRSKCTSVELFFNLKGFASPGKENNSTDCDFVLPITITHKISKILQSLFKNNGHMIRLYKILTYKAILKHHIKRDSSTTC